MHSGGPFALPQVPVGRVASIIWRSQIDVGKTARLLPCGFSIESRPMTHAASEPFTSRKGQPTGQPSLISPPFCQLVTYCWTLVKHALMS